MNKIITLLLLAFLFSCNNKEKKQQDSFVPKVTEAKGYLVPKDSMAEPKVVLIDQSKLKKISIGKLKVVPTNLNVHIAGEPKIKIIDFGKLKSITPGTDTFSLPKVVPAIDSPFVSKQPKSLPSLPLRMKDAANFNIQYLDVDQGMNSSYVWSMLEDKSGNLWFGAEGGGVSKYDGKSFTHYTNKEGLSNNTVRSMLEDKSGNLWFGTNGGGVSKYDGKSFTHYTDKEGMSSNYVRSILEDKSGNLWFGTNGGGVSKYDGKSFTHYTDKEGLSNNTVRSMLEDKSGNLWFGTEGGGVSKYDGKSFTHYTDKEGMSSNYVFSMLEDKSGNLWFGTEGGGVIKYDGKSFTHYTNKEGLSNNTVRSMLEDKSGNLWFGTNGGGVSKYDGNRVEEIEAKLKRGESISDQDQQDLKKENGKLVKSFTHYTDKEGLSNNTVRSILEDKSGKLWFGTNGGGVSKYDGKSFTHYTDKEGLSNNAVLSMLEDKSGNLWFGTYGGGASKYDGKSFTHYTDKEGMSSNYVWSMLEDKSGNLWFGSNGGGVSKYDGNRVEEIEAKLKRGESISDQDQQDLKKENGKLVKSFTHYTDKEGLSNNTVRSMLEDKSGNLWFGINGGGVSKYDGKSFTHYTVKEGLSNNTVLSMLEDKSGNLWFGTNGGGVSKYDGNRVEEIEAKLKRGESISDQDQQDLKKENGKLVKSFTHYTDKEGLSNNTVWSMLEDKSGNLWFGTYGGGVSKYDGKSFTHYTDKEGLSNNTVWSMLEDKSGNLWLSTEKGLNCFVGGECGLSSKKLQNGEEKSNTQILIFHKEDGLKAEDFLKNSVLLDSKNQIWWGSGKALSMLDLNDFNLNDKEPEIQLENIYLQENFVDYRSLKTEIKDSLITNKNEELKKVKFTGVADFHNYPKDLVLPYYVNHLIFNFSAIDWYAPHKIKHQYKLEGLDEDWSNLTTANTADYRNIPCGSYTFKVKAIGSANKWSKTFEYSFAIHPPWWRTWWAYTIYGVLVITIVSSIVWWNGLKLRARAKLLIQKVDEATREIKEQKHLVEEKHKEIRDSINYAERIQRALLASKKMLDENLSDYFILFKPKDVVSGDFYWATKLSNNSFVLVNADSTGHGVPGAIMSILNIACLKEASLQGITSPDLLLNETRRLVIENLKHDGSPEGGKDGMDGSLLSFDFKNNILHCASANNPIWIIRSVKSSGVENKIELIEIKADHLPIGKHHRDNIPFTLHTLNIQKGDVVYTLTDGFSDQFGGPKEKKFKHKQLQNLLLTIAHEPMETQKQTLNEVFDNWKGNLEQVDDVCLIGVRV